MVAQLKAVTLAALLTVGPGLAGSAAAQDKPSQASKPDPAQQLAGFHVVLLAADDKSGPGVQGVTPAVANALQEVQQFLPFKNYRLLDSTLIRGAEGGKTRLNGVSGTVYSMLFARLSVRRTDRNVYSVSFYLAVPEEVLASHYNPVVAKSIEPVLSSQLNLSVGETVVVGTSRISAESGLVAILTALPQSAIKQ